jgi:hypothetical protein
MTIQEFNKTKIGVKRPPFSKEWIENLSKSHLGHKPTQETIEKMKRKIPWNKGIKMSDEFKKKISISFKGRKQSPETIEKRMSKFRGENSPHWKGGVTPLNEKIRKSIEYKFWRKSVFERDNFICQCCNISGGVLRAHHINNFSDFPELRTVIENGITLCDKCHKEFHKKYSCKNNTREQLIEFLVKT